CSLLLPETEKNIYTKGLIRVMDQQKNKIRMGVQFIDLQEDVQNAIERYIATTLEYLEGE
ncbi:MAG: PilZ domain-containing protein, partial [Desulfobulbaceae bacterium]|nr:PilZ domain-containing protein [Desulfobulbaceae bacterium]